MPPEVSLLEKGQRYKLKHWDGFNMAMIIYFIWTGRNPLFEEFESAFAINDETIGVRLILHLTMPK